VRAPQLHSFLSVQLALEGSHELSVLIVHNSDCLRSINVD